MCQRQKILAANFSFSSDSFDQRKCQTPERNPNDQSMKDKRRRKKSERKKIMSQKEARKRQYCKRVREKERGTSITRR